MSADTRLVDGGRDNSEARVRGSEGTCCKLLTQHPKMQVHREQVGLTLEISWAGHEVASSDHPHGRILDALQFLNVRG